VSLDVVCALMLRQVAVGTAHQERSRDYSRPATPRPLLNRKSTSSPAPPPPARLMRLGHSLTSYLSLRSCYRLLACTRITTAQHQLYITVTLANTSLRLPSPGYNVRLTASIQVRPQHVTNGGFVSLAPSLSRSPTNLLRPHGTPPDHRLACRRRVGM
jgi:hypothetical protein